MTGRKTSEQSAGLVSHFKSSRPHVEMEAWGKEIINLHKQYQKVIKACLMDGQRYGYAAGHMMALLSNEDSDICGVQCAPTETNRKFEGDFENELAIWTPAQKYQSHAIAMHMFDGRIANINTLTFRHTAELFRSLVVMSAYHELSRVKNPDALRLIEDALSSLAQEVRPMPVGAIPVHPNI